MNMIPMCLMKKSVFVSIAILSAAFCLAEEKVKSKVKMLGYLKPKRSSEIKNSPWGIQAGTLQNELLEKTAALGVKWTRLNASWPAIERERGKYNWEATDQAFAAALGKGITPFVNLGGANRLYTQPLPNTDPKYIELYGANNPAPPVMNPEAMQAWLAFAGAAVARYKSQIKYWEVWNEPNHYHYWGAEPNGKEYGRLLRETAAVIKNADPDAVVIGGAMAGLDPKFTDDFLGTGAAELINIISYHNYGAIPEERIYKALEVWDVIKKYNPNLKLWQGECGYPSHSSTRDYRGLSPWGLNIQAKWLLRQSFTDIYFCRATLSNYFKLYHEGGRGERPKRAALSRIDSVLGFPERGGSRVKSVGVNEKCLLSNPSLTPKPAYYAYQNLCAIFDDRYQVANITSRIAVNDAGVFYGLGPEDDTFPSVPLVASFKTTDDDYLIAYWLPWHPQEMIRPALIDLELEAVKFNEPVLVDLLEGKVYQINAMSKSEKGMRFSDIQLADYPLVIVERRQIEIVKNKAK